MTEGQLATAVRDAGVRLPFPFQDSGVAAAPSDAVTVRVRPALVGLATPRITVYAVVLRHAAGSVLTVAAVSGSTTEAGSWVLEVAGGQVTVRRVTRQELVRAVVGSVVAFGATTDQALVPRETVVATRELSSADGVAGLRPGRPLATGALGVLDTADTSAAADEQPRHSRSVTWRVYRDGGVLAVEAPPRPRRAAAVTVQAPSPRNLTRAALDLLTGLNARGRASRADDHG